MLFSDLFDYRQKGDYGDLFDFEETDVVMNTTGRRFY
jgi:hypothetical protein